MSVVCRRDSCGSVLDAGRPRSGADGEYGGSAARSACPPPRRRVRLTAVLSECRLQADLGAGRSNATNPVRQARRPTVRCTRDRGKGSLLPSVDAPAAILERPLTSDQRRHLYLLIKEAL